MRECLGWITNCQNEQSCPQNWLELSMSELPTTIPCHMCEQRIELVVSEEELQQRAASALAAFPVVPCTGAAGIPRTPTSAEPANGHYPSPAPNDAPSYEPDPIGASMEQEPPPPQMLAWTCTLQNGEMINVDKDTMIVGRSRTCDIVIQSAKVSRQHASISNVDGELYIEDLGSANGVWYNGEKVTRAKIGHGDSFTISDETLTFESR